MSQHSQLSRRVVIRALGTLAATGVLPLLAACGGSATGTTSASASTQPASTTVASALSQAANASTTTNASTTAARPAVSTATTAAATSAATTQSTTLAAVTSAQPVTSASAAPTTAAEAVIFDGWAVLDPALAALQQGLPGVKVTYNRAANTAAWLPKTLAQAAAGTVGDLWELPLQNFSDFAGKNLVLPLDALLHRDAATFHPEDFYPSTIQAVTWQGKQVAVPFDFDITPLVVNKDAFQQAGVTLPDTAITQNAWTWDAFQTAVAKLTSHQAGQPATRFGFLMQQDIAMYRIWLLAMGGDILTADGQHCALATAAGQAGITALLDLVQKGETPSAQDLKVQDMYKDLAPTGKYGMWLAHASIPGFLNGQKVSYAWDFAPWPAGPKSDRLPTGNNSLAIPQGAKHAESAWQVAKFLTGAGGYDPLMQQRGYAPMRTSLEAAYIQAGPPAGRKYLPDMVKRSQALPPVPNFGQVTTAIINGINDILAGKQSVQAGVTTITQVVDPLLKPA